KGQHGELRYHKEDYRTLLVLHPVHSEIHARGAMTHSLRGMRRADVLKATLAWKNAAGKSKYATPALRRDASAACLGQTIFLRKNPKKRQKTKP
ncbi:hypothetical protein AB9E31_35850, partial [Rhizobium leguminosarum]